MKFHQLKIDQMKNQKIINYRTCWLKISFFKEAGNESMEFEVRTRLEVRVWP